MESVRIKKIINVVLMILIVMPLALSLSKEEAYRQSFIKQLSIEGVNITDVDFDGDEMIVTISSESATNYDTELIYYYGAIFGVSTLYPYDKVKIITTLDDEPVVEMTAYKEAIDKFIQNEINDTVFWATVEVKQPEKSSNSWIFILLLLLAGAYLIYKKNKKVMKWVKGN